MLNHGLHQSTLKKNKIEYNFLFLKFEELMREALIQWYGWILFSFNVSFSNYFSAKKTA